MNFFSRLSIKRTTCHHAEELRKINEESAELVDKIASVKKKAEMSEDMVKSICSEIRSLDFAKKNITFTITALK